MPIDRRSFLVDLLRPEASRLLLPLVAWLAGSSFFFHPALLSGFHHTIGSFLDSRLTTYLLEHSYRWLFNRPTHESFWDLPIYFPARGVFAYSETFISVAPVFWIWRLIGLASDNAFDMWMFTAASLNFFAAYLMMRRGFGFEQAPATAGGFICAYGHIRAAQLHHPQLIPQFFSFFAVYALCRLLRDPAKRNSSAILALFACTVGQIYGSFYLGWFLVLGLAIAALWALFLYELRRRVITAIRSNGYSLSLSLIASAAALSPLVLHGLEIVRQSGWRSYEEVTPMIPPPQAWIYMGRRSWLYFWLRNSALFQAIQVEHEARIGIGIICTMAVALGLWHARRNSWIQLATLSALTIIILSTAFGGASLWRFIYLYVPGGAAIRAVSRIGLLLLIPAGVGLASFVQSFGKRPGALLILALSLAEQGYSTETYSKASARLAAEHVASYIEPACPSYYVSVVTVQGQDGSAWLYQMDATMAQLILEVPTVNGYSGKSPPGYGTLDQNVVESPADRVRIRQDFSHWLVMNHLRASDACLVEIPAPY